MFVIVIIIIIIIVVTASQQVMLSTPSESYVPFFQTKEAMYKVPRQEKSRYKKHPPPLPAPRKSTKAEAYVVTKDGGYDNHGERVGRRAGGERESEGERERERERCTRTR